MDMRDKALTRSRWCSSSHNYWWDVAAGADDGKDCEQKQLLLDCSSSDSHCVHQSLVPRNVALDSEVHYYEAFAGKARSYGSKASSLSDTCLDSCEAVDDHIDARETPSGFYSKRRSVDYSLNISRDFSIQSC